MSSTLDTAPILSTTMSADAPAWVSAISAASGVIAGAGSVHMRLSREMQQMKDDIASAKRLLERIENAVWATSTALGVTPRDK